jgi:thiol-disulfide isomerase/thioredoxin
VGRRTYVVHAAVAAVALALGVWLARSLAPLSTSEPPQQRAAAWRMEDLQGRPETLGGLAASLLLVNFWATWCAPCREEIPLLVRLREEYRERGLEVVGAAIDDPDAVRRYREQLNIPYPLLIVRGDAAGLLREWGSSSGALPFSVLRDGKGNIIATKTGPYSESELRHLLEQHLAL